MSQISVFSYSWLSSRPLAFIMVCIADLKERVVDTSVDKR